MIFFFLPSVDHSPFASKELAAGAACPERGRNEWQVEKNLRGYRERIVSSIDVLPKITISVGSCDSTREELATSVQFVLLSVTVSVCVRS